MIVAAFALALISAAFGRSCSASTANDLAPTTPSGDPQHNGRAEASMTPAAASVVVETTDASRDSDSARSLVVVAPDLAETPLSRVEVMIRNFTRTGDVGIDHTAALLKGAMDQGWEIRNKYAFLAGTPEQYAQSTDINPLQHQLTPGESAVCKAIIDQYSAEITQLRFEEFLLGQIGVIEAVKRGSFKEIPKGDPTKADTTYLKEIEAELGQRDFNAATIPGRDYRHNRVLYFTRSSYPEFFAIRDAMDVKKAELQLALRSYFLYLRR